MQEQAPVELLAQMHQHNEKRYAEMFAKTDERLAHTDRQIRRLGRFINVLGQLVLDHEQRIKRIEIEGEEDDENDEHEDESEDINGNGDKEGN